MNEQPPRELRSAQIDHLRQLVDLPDLTDTRYELVDRLGRGGMGTVFLVHDRELDRDVALKAVAVPGDEALSDRLLAEARVLAGLEHPGIVPIHDVGRLADGRVYSTMKFIQGETLDTYLKRVRPGRAGRIGILIKLCEALGFAHERGVVHRDVKPRNIMIGPFGEVLLVDWGIAGAAGREPGLGTEGYMAPEQAAGGPIDHRVDIHALGVLAERIMAGYESRALRAIARKAAQAAPEQRYPTAGALANDLAAALVDEPVSALPDRPWNAVARWTRHNQFVLFLILGFVVVRLLFLFLARH